MSNQILVTDIKTKNNTVRYCVSAKGEVEKYFLKDYLDITYDFDLENIPESILVIPLLGTILPVAWLCDAEIIVDEIDQDFMDNILQARAGFQEMYPMLKFAGKITGKTVKNTPIVSDKKSGCFFSGGVDAFTTLYKHLDEKPLLITIWGSDIKLTDEEGWNNVHTHIKDTAATFDLDYTEIKSDFRALVSEGLLNKFVKTSGDGWWHGFHCGIGLITHAAVIAYYYGLEKVYIASSNPEYLKGQYTCSSDPITDNHIVYSGCYTIHDGYELDRQEKVKYILNQSEIYKKKPVLRVCWQESGGKNCCHCEKCYRTILEIVSEGGNPNQFGFDWTLEDIKECEKKYKNLFSIKKVEVEQYYHKIQEALVKNRAFIENINEYNWLINFDFDNINNHPMKKFRKSILYRGVFKILRILNLKK